MAQLATAKFCVSQASQELGITRKPISTINAQDQDIAQMVALMSAVADELLLEEPFKSIYGDDVWCNDANGNPKTVPTADDDVILFDARLMIDGLKYRFNKAKGLEFGEEMRDFINRMNKIAVRNLSKVIDLDADEGRIV